MFQKRARNATATASPVNMSGVARDKVSVMPNFEPTTLFTIRMKEAATGSPAQTMSEEQSRRLAAIANSGAENTIQ